MKTHVYKVWTDLVNEFVKNILINVPKTEVKDDTDSLGKQVDEWLDKGGNLAFQMAQGMYYMSHLKEYQEITKPFAERLSELASEQISVGFKGWFDALLKQFPMFNNDAVQALYKELAIAVIDTKFHSYIAMSYVFTHQLAQSGNPTNMDKTYEDALFLRDACTALINSMDEARNKKPAAASTAIPRNPTSPAFHKAAVVEISAEETNKLEQNTKRVY